MDFNIILRSMKCWTLTRSHAKIFLAFIYKIHLTFNVINTCILIRSLHRAITSPCLIYSKTADCSIHNMPAVRCVSKKRIKISILVVDSRIHVHDARGSEDEDTIRVKKWRYFDYTLSQTDYKYHCPSLDELVPFEDVIWYLFPDFRTLAECWHWLRFRWPWIVRFVLFWEGFRLALWLSTLSSP